MKRSEFIIGSSMAVAALWLIPSYNFNIISKRRPKVLIIGAGLAGLCAAYELSKAGLDYTILEGSPRTGGRILTRTIKGNILEYGAEWIGYSHTKLRALCSELNLPLSKHAFETHLSLGGNYYTPREWTTASAEQSAQMLFNPPGPLSAFSRPNNEMDFKIFGGTSRIVNALEQRLEKNSIRLNHKVDRVVRNDQEYLVHCQNGQNFRADALICALPAPLAQHIIWEPQLSEAWQKEIINAPYQTSLKIPLGFEQQMPGKGFEILSDQPLQYGYQSNDQSLNFCLSGDNASRILKLNNEAKRKNVLKTLRPVLDTNILSSLNTIGYYIGLDASRMHSYAVMENESFETPDFSTNLFFCGDYLNAHRGFMESAVLSARYAVKCLLS